MTPLLLNELCMMLIVVGEFLSACLQVVHLFMVVFRASSRPGWLSCAYEAAVQLHLGIALCITVGTGVIRAPLLAEVLGFSRFFWLLWANAAFSFIALAFALYFSRPALFMDALLMGLCTPGAIGALGAHWNIVALLDVSWFMFRGLSSIVTDVVWRSEELTGLSAAEALMGMPAGILVTGPSGGSTFMNASMRSSLEELGLPTDLGDLSGIWGSSPAAAVASVPRQARSASLPSPRGGRRICWSTSRMEGRCCSSATPTAPSRAARGSCASTSPSRSPRTMLSCRPTASSRRRPPSCVRALPTSTARPRPRRICVCAPVFMTSWGSACRSSIAISRWERRTRRRSTSSNAFSRRS